MKQLPQRIKENFGIFLIGVATTAVLLGYPVSAALAAFAGIVIQCLYWYDREDREADEEIKKILAEDKRWEYVSPSGEALVTFVQPEHVHLTGEDPKIIYVPQYIDAKSYEDLGYTKREGVGIDFPLVAFETREEAEQFIEDNPEGDI